MVTAPRAIKKGAAKKTTAKKTARKTAAKKTAPKKKAASKRAATKKVVPKEVAKNEPGVDEPGNSLVMVRIGGHEYPQVSSRFCHTCQSPHRRWIENEILKGRSYRSIARRLEDMATGEYPHPDDRALARHIRDGHVPSPAMVRREIVDLEAKRMGQALEGHDSLVTHRVANQSIIQRGYERLMEGEIDVSVSDLLQAIGAQQRIDATSAEGYDVEVMQSVLMVYLEIAQEYIPPEMMQRYGAAISKHPVIRSLAAKQRADQEPVTAPQTQTA